MKGECALEARVQPESLPSWQGLLGWLLAVGQCCAGPRQGPAAAQVLGTLLGLMPNLPHALGASQTPLHPLRIRGLSQSQALVPGWGDSCGRPGHSEGGEVDVLALLLHRNLRGL